MTESITFSSSQLKSVCRCCLRCTNELFNMSPTEVSVYQNIVDNIVIWDNKMQVCIICKWMLRKFCKFKHQCLTANELLNQLPDMDPKTLFLLHLTDSHNLVQSLINTTSYHEDTTIDNINTEEPFKTVVKDDENFDDGVAIDDDDDEVPLVMLSNIKRDKETRVKKKKRKRVKDSTVLIEAESPAMESPRMGEEPKKSKQLRDGFSSRMVQETEEYIVIKLSKEEVLKEMEDRYKSEPYVRSPYKCEKCVRGFNFEDVLTKHMEKHSLENGPFECPMCTQHCPSAVSLRGHLKSHTTRYKCKICGHVRISRQHLLEHHALSHRRDDAPRYSCVQCPFTSSKRTVIQRHVRSHGAATHACHQCGKHFKTVESLRVHTLRHDKSSQVRCSQCDKTFVYRSQLQRHVANTHDARLYYCVECDVHFASPESLRTHFKRAKNHRDSTSYKYTCDQCTASFPSTASLAAHRASAHGAARPHACVTCARAYSSADGLRAHVWRAHGCGKRCAHRRNPKLQDRVDACACDAHKHSLSDEHIKPSKDEALIPEKFEV